MGFEIPRERAVILQVVRPIENHWEIESLCCGVRSKRDHSVLYNVTAAADCHARSRPVDVTLHCPAAPLKNPPAGSDSNIPISSHSQAISPIPFSIHV